MISCQPHASWSYCVFISSLDICVYPYRAILSVFIYVYDKIEMFIWYLLLNMLYIHSNFFIKRGWQNYTFHIKLYSFNLSVVPVLCQLFWNTTQHFLWTYQWELIDWYFLSWYPSADLWDIFVLAQKHMLHWKLMTSGFVFVTTWGANSDNKVSITMTLFSVSIAQAMGSCLFGTNSWNSCKWQPELCKAYAINYKRILNGYTCYRVMFLYHL